MPRASASTGVPSRDQLLKGARRAQVRREIGGAALLLAAFFIAGALLAPGAAVGQSCTSAGGAFGPAGACLRSAVLVALGGLAAVIVPFIPAVHALRLLGRIEETEDRRWLFFTAGLVAIVPVASALARGATIDAARVDVYAGLVGSFVAFYLAKALGLGGAWVIVALAACALTAGTLAWNPIRLLVGGRKRPSATEGCGSGAAASSATQGLSVEGAHAAGLTKAEVLAPDAQDMPVVDHALMDATADTTPEEDESDPPDAGSAARLRQFRVQGNPLQAVDPAAQAGGVGRDLGPR